MSAAIQEAAAPSEEPVAWALDALVEIRDRHIPDCPAHFAGSEQDWVERQYIALRRIARDAIERASPAVAPVAVSVKATTLAEAIVLTVKKFIKAEIDHARKLGDQVDAVNTTRDQADNWHAELLCFSIADCDAALKLIRRRSSIIPATKGGGDVKELVERAFDIGRMWNHALTGHVCDARDVARTLQSNLFEGLPIAPWPINMHSSRDDAIVAAVKAIKAALLAALSAQDTDGVAK